MNRRRVLAVIGAAALAAGALALWLGPRYLAKDAATSQQAARLARGGALYAEYCAACHGAALEGQPDWRARLPSGELPAPPHDATGHTWHHSDRQLFDIVKQGIGPFAPEGYRTAMRGFGDVLTDDDIRAILAFVKQAWPPDIRARQSRL